MTTVTEKKGLINLKKDMLVSVAQQKGIEVPKNSTKAEIVTLIEKNNKTAEKGSVDSQYNGEY